MLWYVQSCETQCNGTRRSLKEIIKESVESKGRQRENKGNPTMCIIEINERFSSEKENQWRELDKNH